MTKKVIKLIISIILFWSIIYAIFKTPELIYNEETQEKLIETSENLDENIDNLFLTWNNK